MDPSIEIVSLLHNTLTGAPLFMGYIDPGTGSMLLTIIVSLVTAGTFAARKLALKLKFLLHGGKAAAGETLDKLPVVIFSDDKRYWNVFEPICDEFEARGICAQYWTASQNDPALSKAYTHVSCKFIGEGNTAFARLNVMKAYLCLSTTPGLDVLQWKRSQDTDWYVHVFHAVDDGTLYRMFGIDHYDAVLGNSNMMEVRMRKLEQLRGLPAKEFLTVGLTPMDRLYARRERELAQANNQEADFAAALASGASAAPTAPEAEIAPTTPAVALASKAPATQTAPIAATIAAETSEISAAAASKPAKETRTSRNASANAQPTILLAPSWGPNAILSKFGAQLMEALVRTGYPIIVRPHPQSATSEHDMLESLRARFPESERLHWDFSNDNFATLSQADLMITDFSGVIFEYTFIFDRPLIYAETAFDTSPYDAAWIDEQPWILASLPNIGHKLDPKDFSNLKAIIDDMLTSETRTLQRRAVRDEAWSERGRAAINIVDYVEKKLAQLKEAEGSQLNEQHT